MKKLCIISLLTLLMLCGCGANTENEISETEITTSARSKITTEIETTMEITSEIQMEETTEIATVTHRNGMYGISDKDFKEIESVPVTGRIKNDVTGNWRHITIYEKDIAIEEYALSYYNEAFKNNDEIHAIVNFSQKTTTMLSYQGTFLSVVVHQYVNGDGEDAKVTFSGDTIAEYWVYLDNGDIEKLS